MSNTAENSDFYGIGEYNGPVHELEIEDLHLELTWLNTTLRSYDVGEGMYDHLLHQKPDGEIIAVLLDKHRLHTLTELLVNDRFPSFHSPFLDATTIKWFTELTAQALDEDLINGRFNQ